MNAKIIFTQLNCGGVGYSPVMIKIKQEYFVVSGVAHGTREYWQKIYNEHLVIQGKPAKYFLWLRHKNDNPEITAKELYEKLTI